MVSETDVIQNLEETIREIKDRGWMKNVLDNNVHAGKKNRTTQMEEVEGQNANAIGDISISHLNSMENENFPGLMDFDMGIVSHSKYGSACLRGTLPLVLKEGEFKSTSDEAQERAIKIIQELFDKNNLDFGDAANRDLAIRNGVAATTMFATHDLCHPLEIASALLEMMLFSVDDVEESLGLGANYDGDFVNSTSVFNMIIDILKGKYTNLKDLPELDFPALDPILWLTFLAYEQASIGIPDFKTCNKYFLKEILKSSQGMLLMSAPNLVDLCSVETYKEFRTYDIGYGPGIEMMALINGIKDLPKNIRKNLVFQRLVNTGRRATWLINDLLGLKKDIEAAATVESPNNIILFNVAKYGISLAEAVDQVVKQIWEEAKDAEILGGKLLEYYPGDEQLAKFIHCIRRTRDGHIRGYILPGSVARWGRVEFNERWN